MAADKIIYTLDDPHGLGEVYFIWQNGPSAMLLATTGSDGTVSIFNRQGQMQERITLQGLCSGFAWDCDGDLLGIITANSSQVTVWDANTQQKQIVDTGLRDPLSCIIWSKSSQILAVGTARGNLAIYNHQTSKRIPILGKHSKQITCGAWSTENILALGSDDKTLSISSEDGDSMRVVPLRDTPTDMHFAVMKSDEKMPGENTISVILGKRTLYLYHIPEPDSPSELGFQHRYGALIQHKWFGDGFILLGFSNGYVVTISTNPKEMGQELWQVKNHRENLTGVAVCQTLEMVASCGDNTVKMHSTTNLQETVKILTVPDQADIKNMEFSTDGQLLAVCTGQGSICVFVTKLQTLHTVSAPRVALLSSLAEVSIYQYSMDKMKTPPNVVQLEIEPSFIGIGPYHLACGMNNHVWFYDLGRTLAEPAMLLGNREYMSEIRDVQLNALFCAVLCVGTIMLHAIESQNSATKDLQPQIFPENVNGMQEAMISCMKLTSEFLIFGTDLGNLVYFSLENWCVAFKYRHTMGIRGIYSDLDGTKLVMIDDHFQGHIYTPANDDIVLIQNFHKNCIGAVWDCLYPNTFITFDNKKCFTHVHVRNSVDGKHVLKVGETNLLLNQTPLMLYDGELTVCTGGGKLSTITLATHITLPGTSDDMQLEGLLKLRKYSDAWALCKIMKDMDAWNQLGLLAISDLDISFAIKVFRQIGNAAMVYALEDILHVEDANYLAGFCSLLLDKVDKAKSHFAKSVHPQEALQLCRDMLQWEQAMTIAGTLAPSEIPYIAREYGQQLEFTGNYAEALLHYEKGLQYNESNVEFNDHVRLCQAGIARTSIKNGDYRKGVKLAIELQDKELLHDCGEALIGIGNLSEAAKLMELAGYWDKACQLYVDIKSWNNVQKLLPHITSTKLFAVYAQAKEQEGNWMEAIKNYRIAGDLDATVRIYLDHLSDPHSAGDIVVETRSIEGSKMLAKFYLQLGDYEQALQFLILCGCIPEALAIAQRHNKIRQYGELLDKSNNARPADYQIVAQYFENEKYTLLAGKYYFLAKDFPKALKFLLKASTFSNEENTALSLAIDCVASSNNDKLSAQLIEFLLGETDGVPKDPKYLFRLYMARKHYKEAAKTALIIANQEQVAGNYRSAHDLLFTMYQELKRNNLSVSSDMRSNLALLHRYTLVRLHVKIGNHLMAAKLLVQVAANISQFPSHIVPIITSTVIECQRAGLKKSAFTYASMLMRPEYRNQIDGKYSKKIEAVVRKAPRGIKDLEDEFEQETTPCPVCNESLPVMDVSCHHCKTTLPICIATGQHITKEDLVACPECDFPCFKNEMTKILNATNQCPMCTEIVDSNRLNDVENLAAYIA